MSDASNYTAAGPKPGDRNVTFFDNAMIDQLLRAMVTLTMELSVTRERLDSLEHILQSKQDILSKQEFETLSLSLEEEQSRAASRSKLVKDVFGPLTETLEKG